MDGQFVFEEASPDEDNSFHSMHTTDGSLVSEGAESSAVETTSVSSVEIINVSRGGFDNSVVSDETTTSAEILDNVEDSEASEETSGFLCAEVGVIESFILWFW